MSIPEKAVKARFRALLKREIPSAFEPEFPEVVVGGKHWGRLQLPPDHLCLQGPFIEGGARVWEHNTVDGLMEKLRIEERFGADGDPTWEDALAGDPESSEGPGLGFREKLVALRARERS